MSEEILFVPARWFTKGRIKPIQLLIVHSMEAAEKGTTAENIARYFQTTTTKASAHFCIDADSIVQCVKLEDTAYHCKNANANGIGLEHAGFAKQSREEWLDEYSRQTLERSAKLVAELCGRFDIPIQKAEFKGATPVVLKAGICGHADVPQHGSHWDPGPHFVWDWYLEQVQKYKDQKQSA